MCPHLESLPPICACPSFVLCAAVGQAAGGARGAAGGRGRLRRALFRRGLGRRRRRRRGSPSPPLFLFWFCVSEWRACVWAQWTSRPVLCVCRTMATLWRTSPTVRASASAGLPLPRPDSFAVPSPQTSCVPRASATSRCKRRRCETRRSRRPVRNWRSAHSQALLITPIVCRQEGAEPQGEREQRRQAGQAAAASGAQAGRRAPGAGLLEPMPPLRSQPFARRRDV